MIVEFHFRIESYSCKMAGNDKRLFKSLNIEANEGGHATAGLQALSPPQSALSHSPVRFVKFYKLNHVLHS